jgi:hypothetical protein
MRGSGLPEGPDYPMATPLRNPPFHDVLSRQKRITEGKRAIAYAGARGLLEHPFEYPIHGP